MSRFRTGDLVDITIKGCRITGSRSRAGAHSLNVQGTDRAGRAYAVVLIDPDHDAIQIDTAAPDNWPPQKGDLWRAERTGETYFAVAYSPDADNPNDCFGSDPDGYRIILIPATGDESHSHGAGGCRPENVNLYCGPLTLLYRAEVTP